MLLLIRNLTNIDSLHHTVLSSITVLETIVLFFDFFLFGFTIYLEVQTPFHWNLRLVITVVFLQYYVAMISRVITLALQMHVTPFEGEFETSTLVLLCSLCRMYYFAMSCIGITMVFVERGIANILIVDYETKFRRYIGITLSVQVVIYSAIASFSITFEYAPWVLIAICVVVTNSVTTMLFMCLLWKNQRRYNRIVIEPTRNNDSTVQYTLSIRFQLNENIRSMKLLQNLVFTGTVSNFGCFVFLAASHIDFLHFYSDVVAHYFDAALNLYIAIYATMIPIIGYYSDDTYKNIVRALPVFGRFFHDSSVFPERTTVEEGHIYFANLHRQWNVQNLAKC